MSYDMTEAQQIRITQLKGQRVTHREIAERLGLRADDVSLYARRGNKRDVIDHEAERRLQRFAEAALSSLGTDDDVPLSTWTARRPY